MAASSTSRSASWTTQRTCSLEDVGRQQVELEVLGAAADGGQHLVRIGGGQHEHHVRRRFLEGLEQGVGRRRGEHVDLVEDVHLGAARASRGRPGSMRLAHVLDPVVGGGVELLEVVGAAGLDGQARLALAAGSPACEVGAVEGLGQDAGGRRLARAAGPAEQVGVADPVVAHGVAQGPDDLLLARHLGEPAGTVAPVEGLVGHRRRAYRGAATPFPGGSGNRPLGVGGRCSLP